MGMCVQHCILEEAVDFFFRFVLLNCLFSSICCFSFLLHMREIIKITYNLIDVEGTATF